MDPRYGSGAHDTLSIEPNALYLNAAIGIGGYRNRISLVGSQRVRYEFETGRLHGYLRSFKIADRLGRNRNITP